MFEHVKKQVLKIDGTTMDVISFGKGKKPMVLIPGLSLQRIKSCRLIRAYMYRAFSGAYRVYVIERKEEIPQGYTIRDIARDVARGMKMLGIKKADVVGISQGGMIAQYLAIDYPKLVHRLVLCVTLSRENEVSRKVVGNWIRLSEKHAYEEIMVDMIEHMYSDRLIKKYRWMFPFLAKIGKHKDLSRFTILAKSCFTCHTYEHLDEIRCPVFVIGGKKDNILTGEASEEIAEKLKCELYMYENLGHSAYEEGKGFQERVLGFLEK